MHSHLGETLQVKPAKPKKGRIQVVNSQGGGEDGGRIQEAGMGLFWRTLQVRPANTREDEASAALRAFLQPSKCIGHSLVHQAARGHVDIHNTGIRSTVLPCPFLGVPGGSWAGMGRTCRRPSR